MGDSVTITAEDYKQLKYDQLTLNLLRGAGVDNWEGIEEALKELPDFDDFVV